MIRPWVAAVAITAGLGAGAFTGAGVAFADDSASPGGTDTTASSEGPSTSPPGIRISQRTLENLSRSDELHSLRLQMAMNRKSRLLSTLSNVLKKASDTAQNVTGNIK